MLDFFQEQRMKAVWLCLPFVSLFFILSQPAATQGIVSAWFPSQVGDTWTYQHEERYENGHGMASPEIGRWREEQTIIRSSKIDEGTLLAKRVRPIDPVPESVLGHIPGINQIREEYVLINGSCVYGGDWEPIAADNQLRPQFRDDLRRGAIPPEFCFPLKKGMTWGNVPGIPPVDDFWTVLGVNADPYGLADATTFHFSAREGSGTMVDRWFTQGIGLLQQISEHHGTYEESRLQLLSTVLSGQTRTYRLTPAHTFVLNVDECTGYGWRHFVRPNGTAFATEDACFNYAKTLRKRRSP
jgi:hypothetical protein